MIKMWLIKLKELTFQNILELGLRLCNAFFVSFLFIQMALLTYKLCCYDLQACMQNSMFNYSEITLKSKHLFKFYRQDCWAFGSWKEFYHSPNLARNTQNNLFQKYSLVITKREDEIYFEYHELYSMRQFATLAYCVFFIQIMLFIMKHKINFDKPLIQMLAARSCISYCAADRDVLVQRVKEAFQNSNIHFCCEILVKFVCYLFLYLLICALKMLLYGQYETRLDAINLMNLFEFPPTFQTNDVELQTFFFKSFFLKEFQTNDRALALILHQIFLTLWYIFLFMLSLHILILFIYLIQFCSPSLRTKTIISLARSADAQVMDNVNSVVGNYYLLMKIAKQVDPFYFMNFIEEVFFIRTYEGDDAKDDDLKNHEEDELNVNLEHINSDETYDVENRIDTHQMATMRISNNKEKDMQDQKSNVQLIESMNQHQSLTNQHQSLTNQHQSINNQHQSINNQQQLSEQEMKNDEIDKYHLQGKTMTNKYTVNGRTNGYQTNVQMSTNTNLLLEQGHAVEGRRRRRGESSSEKQVDEKMNTLVNDQVSTNVAILTDDQIKHAKQAFENLNYDFHCES